jgi:hypothetical protein
MSDNKYNGWSNYETWNWKLWMDNDGDDERLNEEIGYLMDRFESDLGVVVSSFSELLQADCDAAMEQMDLPTCGPFADILGAGISNINWHEIAEHMVDDYEPR